MGAGLYRCSNWTDYKIAINRMEARKWPSDTVRVRCWYRLCVEIRSDINWIRMRNNLSSYRWERDFVNFRWFLKTHQQIYLSRVYPHPHFTGTEQLFFSNDTLKFRKTQSVLFQLFSQQRLQSRLILYCWQWNDKSTATGEGDQKKISLHCSLLTFVRDRHERVRTLSLENLQVPLSSRR